MKKRDLVIAIFLLLQHWLTAQIVPDLPIVIKFFHPAGHQDSVVIGLSLNADDGFDEGLDIIDTTEMKFPLDVRIFDPVVEQQLGGPKTHNLKHSYLSIPNVPRGEIGVFAKEFTVVVTTDSLNIGYPDPVIPYCPEISGNRGLSSTFFKIDMTEVINYAEMNTEGWVANKIGIFNQQVYLGNAIDNTDLQLSAGSIDYSVVCSGLNNYGNIYNKIFLSFRVFFRNKLHVDIINKTTELDIQLNNNNITIDNLKPHYNVQILDITGRIVFSVLNIAEPSYQSQLNLNSNQIYFLYIMDAKNKMIYHQKLIVS